MSQNWKLKAYQKTKNVSVTTLINTETIDQKF